MAISAVGSNGLFKTLRLRSSNISSVVTWGVFAGTTALWIVQPFDWIKNQIFEKPESEEQ
ncbi:Ubiquinol-cytochrome c reductase complex 6.7 kDa protein [Zostera marina]|uniref:Ubiquinol-cytochrome c reductase complex 6.7 kDa protein n=1 Tax=Zostera marina TaxID=29655 RepID=A0A0K9PSE2_ZOSMR|nr:Ubiquinol-cytochrome c reductase complex 6.7 kDa protein [Zostera marina]